MSTNAEAAIDQAKANAVMLEIHAREKAGMPEAWTCWLFRCMPSSRPTLYYELTGAVAPLKVRGKGKGHPDWKKKDQATVRTVVITPAEHQTWVDGWEARTGKCAGCEGTGRVFQSWHHVNGTTYRECPSCRGSSRGGPRAGEAD